MTTTPLHSELCRYHYDALDRSITWTPDRQAGLQRFFCKDRLATEIQNAAQRSIFQHDDQVLAQQNRWGDKVDTTLLATDHQRSVLNAVDSSRAHRIAYTPYGHRPLESGLLSLLGFNGERPDLVTGHYHLGNGYRQFNPVLMRFNSPDKLSPFGKGGINAYAYCGNDPVNWIDPNGSLRVFGIGKSNISTFKARSKGLSIIDGKSTLKNGNRTIYKNEDAKNTIDISIYSKKSQGKIINSIVDYANTGIANIDKLTDVIPSLKYLQPKLPLDDALMINTIIKDIELFAPSKKFLFPHYDPRYGTDNLPLFLTIYKAEQYSNIANNTMSIMIRNPQVFRKFNEGSGKQLIPRRNI